jgi:hypothetical protein
MGDGAVFVESLSGSGVSSSSYDIGSSSSSRSASSGKTLKPSKRPLAAAVRPAKRQKLAADGDNRKARLSTASTTAISNTTSTAAVKSFKQPAVLANGSSTTSSKAGSADREREQGEGLHGSWAARRLQKEKEAGALSAFAGKRTTFDDSD